MWLLICVAIFTATNAVQLAVPLNSASLVLLPEEIVQQSNGSEVQIDKSASVKLMAGSKINVDKYSIATVKEFASVGLHKSQINFNGNNVSMAELIVNGHCKMMLTDSLLQVSGINLDTFTHYIQDSAVLKMDETSTMFVGEQNDIQLWSNSQLSMKKSTFKSHNQAKFLLKRGAKLSLTNSNIEMYDGSLMVFGESTIVELSAVSIKMGDRSIFQVATGLKLLTGRLEIILEERSKLILEGQVKNLKYERQLRITVGSGGSLTIKANCIVLENITVGEGQVVVKNCMLD